MTHLKLWNEPVKWWILINPLWYQSSLLSILHPCCLWTLQWFFFYISLLVSWFQSWIFLFVSFPFLSVSFFLLLFLLCLSTPLLLHLCAGCKTAMELRWEGRELQWHQGEQAICAFFCMSLCWCVALLSGLTLCSNKLLYIPVLV